MRSRKRRRLALVVAMLLMLGVTPFLVAATSGASASKRVALSCGQAVTVSVTLTADITGCGGSYGLTIGADGVTVNLNGHTISGSGATYGVVTAHSSDVIENGKISGFVRGVEIEGGTTTRVQGLRITGNSGAGIFTFDPATITGNIVYGNGSTGIVVGCCTADKVSVTNNVVNGNTGDGIDVSFSAAGSTISGNRTLSNSGNGITVSGAANVYVSSNTANANGGDGFDLSSSDTQPPLTATGNKAYANTQLGISFGAGDKDGGSNKASGNGTLHQCENIVCS